ncbi:hypothetical protein PVAP13_8KG217000 [Panicum virgatum]|uniref:Uncharacterized protein n=1 Tax=Panicum virgatum TaxID=38727 RepID=A0A8T0PTN7_PANVG|nr:hypothetical protein PVAP13_8KG217000 [Panicum virgatum]KAG2561424.1 hypothetical protein PVAP13_8KG217000 [Panicum virgatum]
MESWIEQEEVRGRNNFEVQDVISMSWTEFHILKDNECAPDVVMRFKIHRVKELYYDLQKYADNRDELSQITIGAPANSIEYAESVAALIEHGYTQDARLYYLSPVPGSEPSTGLLKIDGQEDVMQMVSAHAEQRTKICHLYLVNGSDGGMDSNPVVPCMDEDSW